MSDSLSRAKNSAALCPVCERFIGPVNACPYCGAPGGKPLSLRLLRYAALVLAVIGLGLLYLMVLNRDIPVVKVENMVPDMNFAYARVVGTVADDAKVARQHDRVNSISFPVEDGSGTLIVAAYDSRARSIVAAGRIPRKGDRVDVAGTLRVGASGGKRLYLEAPAHLKIEKQNSGGATRQPITDNR